MKLWEKILTPFIALAVIYQESRDIDEYGDWERHHIKKEERRRKKKRETHK